MQLYPTIFINSIKEVVLLNVTENNDKKYCRGIINRLQKQIQKRDILYN